MRVALQRTGLAEKRITCANALRAGFLYAKCHHMPAGFVLVGDQLNALLSKADASFQPSRQHESPEDYKKELRAAIAKENPKAANYFELGFACYAVTLSFGTYPKPTSETEAQAALDNDHLLRKPAGWFLGSLADVGLPQEAARTLFSAEVVPWLVEDRLRRWVGDENMALLGLLTEHAAKADSETAADSPQTRLKLAARSLVGKIPIFGEPLSILLFGTKK